jgi:hypothetical protein
MAGGDTAIRLHRLDTTPSSAGRRPATAFKAVAGGFAAFLAPSAIAVALVVGVSPLVCP